MHHSTVEMVNHHSSRLFTILHGFWMFFLLLDCLHHVQGEYSPCPPECICVENRMNCEKSGLRSLPPPFQLHLETLHVANQTFVTTRLGPSELAVYTSPEYGGRVILKKLFIRFCNIKAIEPKAFRALGSTLEMVDLTGNPLIHVGAYAFAGLGPLTVVLDHIEQPEFDKDAFEDCRMKSLMMQYSNLTRLPIQPLLSLAFKDRLGKLLLRGNRLRFLDRNCDPLFDRLTYFELDDNPWHCDCQLTWLIRRYQKLLGSRSRGSSRHRGPRSDSGPDTNEPRCASPPSLNGRKFSDLITDMSVVYSTPDNHIQPGGLNPPTILHCPPPQIERLDINLEHVFTGEQPQTNSVSRDLNTQNKPNAHLRCAVRGSPQLSVVWRYHHPGLGPTNMPNTSVTHTSDQGRLYAVSGMGNFEPWLDDRREMETAVKVEKNGEMDIYSCLGQDVIGNVSALVRIQWPADPVSPASVLNTPSQEREGARRESRNQTDYATNRAAWSTSIIESSQSSLHTPQFSLSQLLGAIAGTFLSTVFLFFIIQWTLHCRMAHRSENKPFLSKNPPESSLAVSPAGTSSSHTSSTNTKQMPSVQLPLNTSNPQSSGIAMQLSPEALSITANLFNQHNYHHLMNGGLSNIGHHTLPMSMGHSTELTPRTDQTKSISPGQEDGSASQSAAYEPIAYSEARPINYDIPWMVNFQSTQPRVSNEQQVPLLLAGMLTDVNRYAETPHPGLIQSPLMIPPPPPIPQPSLPPSAQSSLTLTNSTCGRNTNMTTKDNNLFALQAAGYPYPMLATSTCHFDPSTSST